MNGTQMNSQENQEALKRLEAHRRFESQKFSDVRSVLIVLSAKGYVFDLSALKQMVQQSYPNALVFFQSTSSQAIGAHAPLRVDLVVDFTGPWQRQPWFYCRKLRKMAKYVVGRSAGPLRKKIYDRVFDEKTLKLDLFPKGRAAREEEIQKAVLALAGISTELLGTAQVDQSYTLGTRLAPLRAQGVGSPGVQ